MFWICLFCSKVFPFVIIFALKKAQIDISVNNELLQSLISGGPASVGNSLNVSQSNNLMSNRSSLTHVTTATNLVPVEAASHQHNVRDSFVLTLERPTNTTT